MGMIKGGLRMWYQETTDKIFFTSQQISYDGVIYPPTIFKYPDQLAAIGLLPAVYDYVDERYYVKGAETKTLNGGVWTISWASTPKDLEVLRSELVQYWLSYLDDTLTPTDKFLTRSAEMAQWFSKWVINPQLQDWRDGIYLLFNTRMNSITEAVTFEGLKLADEQTFTVPATPKPYEVEL